MFVWFFLRTVAMAFARFLVIIGLLFFYVSFEVHPLPSWMLDVFVMLMQFAATYLFAKWAFGKRMPTLIETTIVIILFLVGELFLEGWFYVWLLRAPSWTWIFHGYGWKQIALIIWYLAAIWLAMKRRKRKLLLAHMPEGLV
jgi:hypothetical protein